MINNEQSHKTTTAVTKIPADKARRLWHAYRDGEGEALERLYLLFYDYLFNYGIRVWRNEALVHDIIQDIFLALWQDRNKAPEVAHIGGYLLRMLRNQLIDHGRREARKGHVSLDASEHLALPFLEFSSEDLVITEEENAEKKQWLSQALQKLPDRQKEVLLLKYYHGLSYDEIAEITGLKYQSIRNFMHKAIASLRKISFLLGLWGLDLFLQ